MSPLPWDMGIARAHARLPLIDHAILIRDWGLSKWEARLFDLGYLEGKVGPFPDGTRETFERLYTSYAQAR